MACNIQFDRQGNKIGVLTEEGRPSKLFQQIWNNIHIKTFESALNAYVGVLNPKVMYSIIGENGARNLDKIEESTFRLENLSIAKQMEIAEKSAKDIRLATGWEKVNDQWKYELPNVGFKDITIEINKEYKASEVLDENSEFYKAYPEIKDLIIIFNEDGRNSFKMDRETIELDARGLSNTILPTSIQWVSDIEGFFDSPNVYRLPSNSSRNLEHELTHFAQLREGFYRGGSPSIILSQAEKLSEISRQDKLDVQLEKYEKTLEKENLSQSDRNIIQSALTELKGYPNSLVDSYRNIAGEVEARMVEERINMNPQERLNTLLADTELLMGVNQEDKIFLETAKQSNSEPNLKYKTPDNKIFTTYAEALKDTHDGQIEAGVNTINGFETLFKLEVSTNSKVLGGLLNSLTKSNILTGETYRDTDGKTIYKVSGNSIAKKMITSDIALTEARKYMGLRAVKALKNGDLVFDENHTKRQLGVTKKDGTTSYVTMEELDSKTFEELKKEFDDPIGIITTREFKNSVPTYADQTVEQPEFIPENELQLKLMSLLKEMGVKTMDISDYVEKYAQKNGVEPSAQALADLANNIVAFKDGIITQDTLTEETAHFIIASTPIDKKADLKRNIHKSSQWAEHQQTYRDIYSQHLQGEELEDAVREEILGKVLKDALIANFENESEAQKNIYQKVIQFFNDFFNKVQAFFTNNSQQKLDNFTNNVYSNLINETLINQIGERNTKYTLYSTENNSLPKVSQLYKQTSSLLEELTNQQYELGKKYNSPADKNTLRQVKQEIEQLDLDIEDLAITKAVSNLLRVANSQLNTLTKVIENNLNKGYHFSQEENSVYQNFISKVLPLLNQVEVQISENNKQDKLLKQELQNAILKASKLEGIIPTSNNRALDLMIDRIIQKNSMTEEEGIKYRDSIKSILEAQQIDTSFLHANIGSLMHAKNALLNMAGDVTERVQYRERNLYLPKIKNFLNQLEKIGFNPTKLKSLIKNGHIINEIDSNKEIKANLEDKVKAYKEALGEFNIDGINQTPTVETIDKDLREVSNQVRIAKEKNNNERVSLLNSLLRNYDIAHRQIKSTRYETYFNQDFLDKLNNASVTTDFGVVTKQDIPERAKEVDKNYRSQITQVRLNAQNGILSKNEEYQIKELNKQRLQESATRDSKGQLKNGLKSVYDETLKKWIVVLDDSKQLSDSEKLEAQKIYGLQMIGLINTEFYKDSSNKGIPNKFIEELNKFETEQEKWDFVKLNAYIGFPTEFWDGFKTNETLIDKLRNLGEFDIIEDIKSQQEIITNILKQNRVFNQPHETEVSDMSELQLESIKTATSELEAKYAQAKLLVKDESIKEDNLLSETRTNQSYKQELEDSKEDELQFIRKHVTPSSSNNIYRAQKIAEAIKKGEAVNISKSFSSVFREDMDEEEVNQALLSYARTKLLPYFKRTEPTGFTEFFNDFEERVSNDESGSVLDILNNETDIRISPNYGFFESTEGINKKWLENRDAKKEQYSKEWLDRVRDEEFYTKFDLDEQGNRKSNKNEKEWKAREILLELQDWSIENYNLTGVHNRYLLPQKRKGFIRRGFKGAKESVLDFVSIREDEQDLGQDISGKTAKKGSTLLTIPTYGIQKIENQEDVSDELLESYAWFAQQSSLYLARRENISDMLVLHDLITDRDYNGKEAHATNTYKMFKSFLQSNFYGVKESFSMEVNLLNRKIDLAKIAKSFNNYVRFSNLTGITVPITGFTTGKVAEFLEKVVGETINPTAYKLAHYEFTKQASATAREIAGFSSKSDLNVLGEYFGMYNLVERFEHSGYDKASRVGLKSANLLHTLGNFPVTSTTMLSVLYDYRYSDNDILSFEQFKKRGVGKSSSEILQEWKKLKLFKDDIKIQNGVVVYDINSISENVKVDNLEELLNLKAEAISTRVASAIQRVDSQVPEHQKSIASRDARANFLLMHLNWFLIQIQLKTKDRHYNISEDSYQEGNWRTTFNFIQDMILNPKDIKETWKKSMADEVTRKNLKRTTTELAIANAIAIAAILLSNYVDDDKEDPSWLLAWTDYMLTRTAVEQVSGTVALPKQVGEILTNPIIATQRAYDLMSITDLANFDDVKKGTYAGSSKSFRWAAKNLPVIKDYNRLRDPKKAQDNYTYFSVEQPNLFNNWAWLSTAFDKDEK